MKNLIIAFLFLVLLNSVFPQKVYFKQPEALPIKEVIDEEVYDVYILNSADGNYYMTGTWIGKETKTPLWKSENLKDWEFAGTILKSESALRAPEIYEIGDSYYLLITEREGLSVYKSSEVISNYNFHSRLSETIQNASLFFEAGKIYMISGGGYIVELNSDLSKIISEPVLLHPSYDIERPDAPGWATEKQQFLWVGTEGGRIIKENNKYYLFATDHVTRLNSSMYDILYSVSENLYGPYTARKLGFMHAGSGTVFKAKDDKYYCAFSAKTEDKYIIVNKKPVITPVHFFNDNEMIGYTGEYYFEKEPIGNTINRLPNVQMRDPSITTGPDGWYYLVHTEVWDRTEFGLDRIMLRRSKDLRDWEDVGYTIKCSEIGLQFDGTETGFKDGDRMRLWAPEIKYIESKDVYMLSVSIPNNPNNGGMQTWIFKSKNPEGPYQNISDRAMHKGIDGFFYEEDGRVYYLYGSNYMVEMNDDLTGFVGEFRELEGLHGIEGMSLIKINGKYLLSRSDNTGGPGTATYEAIYGISDNIWGPYEYKGSVSHCGHTTMFLGHDGKWRLTMFGSDSHAPVHHGLGILQFELDENDKIIVKEDWDGFTSIFDGKTFDGWKTVGANPESWTIEDGNLLMTSYKKGRGYLQYEKWLKDFEFKCEWKVDSAANSGIFLRIPKGEAVDPTWDAVEFQISDDINYPIFYHEGDPRELSGGIYGIVAPTKSKFNGLHVWNKFHIICKGTNIKLIYNDELVMDINTEDFTETFDSWDEERKSLSSRPLEGYLGLQTHNGSRVWYRNLQLKELKQ